MHYGTFSSRRLEQSNGTYSPSLSVNFIPFFLLLTCSQSAQVYIEHKYIQCIHSIHSVHKVKSYFLSFYPSIFPCSMPYAACYMLHALSFSFSLFLFFSFSLFLFLSFSHPISLFMDASFLLYSCSSP